MISFKIIVNKTSSYVIQSHVNYFWYTRNISKGILENTFGRDLFLWLRVVWESSLLFQHNRSKHFNIISMHDVYYDALGSRYFTDMTSQNGYFGILCSVLWTTRSNSPGLQNWIKNLIFKVINYTYFYIYSNIIFEHTTKYVLFI